MKIILFILKLFGYNNPMKYKNRKQLKDVVAGEYIVIEWSRIQNNIGRLKCLNNDPFTKKIFLQVRWNNFKEYNCDETELIIFSYNDKVFKNFSLLNPINMGNINEEFDDEDIIELQNEMNQAIESEDYEKAELLQKKIDKLSNK